MYNIYPINCKIPISLQARKENYIGCKHVAPLPIFILSNGQFILHGNVVNESSN